MRTLVRHEHRRALVPAPSLCGSPHLSVADPHRENPTIRRASRELLRDLPTLARSDLPTRSLVRTSPDSAQDPAAACDATIADRVENIRRFPSRRAGDAMRDVLAP